MSPLLVPLWYGVRGMLGAGVTELRVSKWKRHGLDRLYVNTSDGTAVAWFDQNTGHIEVMDEALRQPILDVLAPYMTRSATPLVAVAPARLPLRPNTTWPYGALVTR